MENYIKGPDPPHYGKKIKNSFYLKLDHFWALFVKSVFSTLKIAMMAATRKILAATHAILALTWFCICL